MESVEGTGQNVEEALENALDEIGLERDEVEVAVLSEGADGGGARVLVTALALDDDDDAVVAVSPDAAAAATVAEDILVELLDYMDLPSEVVVDRAEMDEALPSVEVSIHGEFGGILIGRHGETLGALQFLLGLLTSRRVGRRVRVSVDVEGYRERRAKLLRDVALRAADRAQRYRQPIFMDPMLPNERRIVHLALQENPNVSTHSIGEGDNRRVVVSPRQASRFGGYRVE
ncbi:MAG: KH domain-containing protein [Chloroflexi bacterium]|nr:KH domain-containing protein [Chloroflexota bacterium]